MTYQFERGFTLQEAVELLVGQDEDMPNNVELFIAPPEPSVLTDEDSAGEDEGGLLDNLSGRQLTANAEIKMPNNILIDSLPTTTIMPRPTPELRDFVEVHGYKNNVIRGLISEKRAEVAAKKKKTTVRKTWIEGDLEPNNKTFPKPNFSKYQDFSASELFELFFDDKLFNILVCETERYASVKKGENPHISKDELKCFIGILVLTGCHPLPGARFYWDSNPDMGIDFVINAMRRNRFQQILRSLHCVDNNNLVMSDKMWTLRPMLNKIKSKSLEHFQPEQNLSYDESMVEYFGRHGCKQHIRGKPIGFGFKVWCLNTVSGYLVAFDVYQGKSLGAPSVYEELFGKSAAPLVKLLDELPQDKQCFPYRIYFDNLFTN